MSFDDEDDIDDDNIDDVEDDGDDDESEDLVLYCPVCSHQYHEEYLCGNFGACSHLVFSYECVNFEYTMIDPAFTRLAIEAFEKIGIPGVKELPCPLEEWARYDDDMFKAAEEAGLERQLIPSLDKVVPDLMLEHYIYSGVHGHGGWGVVLGFLEEPPQKPAPNPPTTGRER